MISGVDGTTTKVSNETYYLNIDCNEWKRGPHLKIAREGHTAGVLIDHATRTQIVAVVGGWDIHGNYIDSVELLLHGQNDWMAGIFIHYFEYFLIQTEFVQFCVGPSLNTGLSDHQMVRIGLDLIVLGGFNGSRRTAILYKLSCTNNQCEWETLSQKLAIPKDNFVAI